MRRLVLALALLLMPMALAAQSDDRGFVQGLLEDALSAPGRNVRVEGFAGALSSRATIDRITVSDADGVWLSVEDVTLVWTRSALLSGRVEIDEITAARIALTRPPLPADTALPSAEARGAFSLPELPVSVRLGQLALDEVALGAPFLGQPVALRVKGAAQLENGAGDADLQVERLDAGGALALTGAFDNALRVLTLDLSLTEPQGGIAATALDLPGLPSVALEIRGEAPINDYRADIRLETDGQERLTGALRLRSPEDGSQRFGLDVSGDLAPVLAPEYRAFLGPNIALSTEGTRAADGTLSLDDLSLSAEALALSGAAMIGPDGWPQRFDLRGRILAPSGGPVLLPLPGTPTRLTGARIAARFDADAGNTWTLQTLLEGLDRADFRAGRLSLEGEGEIDRDASRVTGAVMLDGADLAPADPAFADALGDAITGALRFDWAPDQPLALRDMDLGGDDYGVTGAVSLDGLADDFNLRIRPDLRLRATDLGRFAGLTGQALRGAALLDIAGDVSPLSGLLSLDLDGQTTDLQTGIARLDPLLRGTGTLVATVIRDTQGTRLAPLRIRTDAARIEASGTLATGASSLTLDASLTEAGDVLPQLAGPASLTAEVSQQGDLWQVSTRATGPGGADAGFDGTVSGDGRETLTLDGTLVASVDALSAYTRLAGRPLGGALSLRAQGRGDPLQRSLDARATLEGTDLRSGIATLDTLLRGNTRVATRATAADGVLRIEQLALDASGLGAQVQGRVSDGDSALTLSASLPDLGRLVPELPGPASASGTVRQAADGRWQLDLAGSGPGGITLNAAGSAAQDGSRLDLALSGVAPLALANERLRPRALSGLVRFDLAVNGPPALSSLSGTVTTDGARLSLPDLRNAVTDIALRARLGGSRAQLDASGRLASGGTFTLGGPVALTPPYAADLSSRLSNITLQEPGLFETVANGDLTVTGPLAGGARIGGRIGLETVEARLPNIGPSYQVLEGLRHANTPADVQRTLLFAGLGPDTAKGNTTPGPAYPVDLTVDAPNRIFVRGRGLDAELGGSLRLIGTTADIVPQGQFDLIRGRLDLLGRRLTLTEGSISLRGSFDPFIRLAASTDIDGTSVTIAIEGAATDPVLSIRSEPELPEEEALSLLLFGKSVTSISPLQAVQLAQAVRTLSGQSSGGIVERIRTGLRIDDLDLGTDADGVAQARVGAYISENIYTDVTIQADGDSQINLNLDLTPKITLRGRLGSDGDSGVGLFFEKDY